MVGADGQVKILDFGIGCLLAETEGESLVDTMSTANSVNSGLDCSSPESIMDPTNLNAVGDQYSLGCVMYYCLTGQYPFPDGTAVEKMMCHQHKQPTPILDLNPNVPEEYVPVVEQLMQKAPEARYPSMAEVIEAIRALGQPVGPAPTQRRADDADAARQAAAGPRLGPSGQHRRAAPAPAAPAGRPLNRPLPPLALGPRRAGPARAARPGRPARLTRPPRPRARPPARAPARSPPAPRAGPPRAQTVPAYEPLGRGLRAARRAGHRPPAQPPAGPRPAACGSARSPSS